MISNILNYFYLITILSLLLQGCSDNKSLSPIWHKKADENSSLYTIKNELILKHNLKSYRINKINGKEFPWEDDKTYQPKKINLRTATKDNKIVRAKYSFKEIEYTIIEEFNDAWDEDSEIIFSYFLEKKNETGIKKYLLDGSKEFDVIDFVWMENNLFIIKTSSKGGDAYFLEKYQF